MIIGNPPFLGDKKMRAELGRRVRGRRCASCTRAGCHGGADLVCYWFEQGTGADRRREGKASRAAGDPVHSHGGRIAKFWSASRQTGDIFWARVDRPWILDGAAVDVSMVGFDNGAETDTSTRWTSQSASINADLTAAVDLTRRSRLPENAGLVFHGHTKGGPFDITAKSQRNACRHQSTRTVDPTAMSSSPWVNGRISPAEPRDMWIIDFGTI